MSILEKIRNQSESRRKIILWSAIVVIALVLFLFYLKNIQNAVKNLKSANLKEKMKLPSLSEEFKNLPKLETPGLQEQLDNIKEEMEKTDEPR